MGKHNDITGLGKVPGATQDTSLFPNRNVAQVPPDPTTEEILDFTPEEIASDAAMMARLAGAQQPAGPRQPAAGVLGSEALFPGAQAPILKGTVSTGVPGLGTQPIFAPSGQLVPFDIINARKAAIDAAAAKRAKELRDIELPEPGLLDSPLYQEAFNDEFMNLINTDLAQLSAIHGEERALRMLSKKNRHLTKAGREFNEKVRAMSVFQRQTNQILKKVGTLQAGFASGTLEGSEESKRLTEEMATATGQFSAANARELLGKMDDLDSSLSLDEYFKEFDVIGQITSDPEVSKVIDEVRTLGGIQFLQSTKKSTIDAQIDKMIKGVKGPGGIFEHVDYVTEKRLRDRVLQTFGGKTEETAQIAKKPKGAPPTKEDVVVRDQPKDTMFFGIPQVATISVPIPTTDKKIDFVGAKFLGQGGEAILKENIQSFIPAEFQYIQMSAVDAEELGRRVFGDDFKQLKEKDAVALRNLINSSPTTVTVPVVVGKTRIKREGTDKEKAKVGLKPEQDLRVEDNKDVHMLVFGQEETFKSESTLAPFYTAFEEAYRKRAIDDAVRENAEQGAEGQESRPTINTQAEYDALPSGAKYIDSAGSLLTKR